jgi:hypothetical protein
VSKISRTSNATGVHSSPPRWPGVEWTRICHWNTLGWMGGYASIASGNGVSRRPAFVGRTREFEELRSALSAGFGSLVLVSGEPGIGKSRLLQEVAGYATDQGWQVLPGRCWDGGGAPAYWPWMQVVRAAGEEFERLGPAFTEPVAPDAARFQLFDRVGRFLAGYTAVWTAFGAVAFLGDIGLHQLVHRWPWLEAHPQVIAGSVLMLAGEFQFSKLKDRCLSECRHPASFLLQHYGRGAGTAFRLGEGARALLPGVLLGAHARRVRRRRRQPVVDGCAHGRDGVREVGTRRRSRRDPDRYRPDRARRSRADRAVLACVHRALVALGTG